MKRRVASFLALAFAAVARAEEPPAPARAEAPAPRWPDLAGVWAQRTVTTAEVELPVLGKTELETEAMTRLVITQDGATLSLREQVCSLDSESPLPMVRTEYPANFLRAVSGHPRTARLEALGDKGWAYREDRRVRVLGALLADPDKDPLPTARNDDRLRDPDRDRRPGVTVRVRGMVSGELFVVQRSASALAGALVGDARLEGRIAWSSEQTVVGATSELLRSSPPSRPHPDPARSFFVMQRIPAEVGCEAIVERRGSLFGLED
jgi:hypothetical protein